MEQLPVEETVAILRIPAGEVLARVHRAVMLSTGLLERVNRNQGVAFHRERRY